MMHQSNQFYTISYKNVIRVLFFLDFEDFFEKIYTFKATLPTNRSKNRKDSLEKMKEIYNTKLTNARRLKEEKYYCYK